MLSVHSSTRFRAVLATAVALVAVLALSACQSAVGSEAAGARDQPRSGGVLRVGVSTDLVPAVLFTGSNSTITTITGNVFDTLIDYPSDGLDPQPRLATSWELTPDGRSLTLHLRPGVKFHDGADFTSKDVEFSLRTWADPKWTVQFQRTAAAVRTFDTSDPQTIVLGFERPVGNIFDLLDAMPIISEASFDPEATGHRYVGTGPFKFVEWTPRSKVVLTRNDDYWDGKPRLDGIQINVVPDAQSLISQVRSGQLDLAPSASTRNVDTLVEAGRHTSTTLAGAASQTYLGANVTHPALQDLRLRQAIALAVDKQRILQEVQRGHGRVIALPWPEYSPAYDPTATEQWQRDIPRAKALVAELGAVPNLPLEYSSANPDLQLIAQIVQENLAEIGVTVTLQPNENAQHIEKLIQGKFSALWLLSHSYAQYTPSTLAVSAYPFNANRNSSHFDDADYKRHTEAAWGIADPNSVEAKAAYREINNDLLSNLFLIELSLVEPRVLHANAVHDLGWTKRTELVFAKTWLED